MKRFWHDLRAAGAFLTLFPVANSLPMDEQRLRRSMGLFPVVGLLLGLLLLVCNWLMTPLLPRGVVDCLLLLVLIAATGALHLDGFADLLDGFAGGRDRASVLRIMKDSRVGAVGAVGLIMLLLLKYQSLNQLPVAVKPAALLLMPTAGRWMQVFLASLSSYVRPEGGTGSLFVDHVGRSELGRASLTLVLVSLVLFAFQGVALLFGLLVLAVLLLHFFERRLGGVTGDVLGAATELTELLTLLLILAIC